MYVYFEEIRKLIIIYYPLPKLADNKVAQNQSVISGFFSWKLSCCDNSHVKTNPK